MATLAEKMQELKDAHTLTAYCDTHLKARGAGWYVCPFCNSGENGNSNTAAFHIDPNGGDHVKCFVCGFYGDVYDLAGKLNNTDDTVEQYNLVAASSGAELWEDQGGEAYDWNDTVQVQDEPTPQQKPQKVKGEAAGSGDEEPDYSVGRAKAAAYVAQCQARIEDPVAVAYLAARGIDLDTARAWGLGYDPEAGGAKDPSGAWCRRGRIVIPWAGSSYYHIDRSVDPTAKDGKYKKPTSKPNDKNKKPLDECVGPQPLWNPAALKAPTFFICEGPFDALAVQSCGYEAMAVGSNNLSTANAQELAEAMEHGDGVAVLMLDNDEQGQKGQAKLTAAMDAKHLPHIEAPVAELGTKDAGELLQRDRERLAALLTAWHEDAVAHAEEIRAEAWRKKMEAYHVIDPAVAVRELYELKEARAPISTGFTALDTVLGGGLHAKSLHIIGAQSSEGKTTLSLQVADFIAKSGRSVLFVTIEQRPSELIAKSLSRTIWQASGGHEALPALDILNPLKRTEWHEDQLQTLACARDAYAEEIAPHMLYMDPDARPNVDKIEEWARLMAERDGEAPCVFIDYLQLLLPENERDSDKTTTDKNVTALRRMAGRLNTPVWVVASLNRQSYTAPIATDSFKESGAIEYGADVLMGLEPFDLDTRWHNETEKKRPILALGMHDKTRRATKRWMDLRVLKNRFGSLTDYGIPFMYQANADTFKYVSRIQREPRNEDKELAVGGEANATADVWDF